MTLGFLALPADTQNIVFSNLTESQQFCLWSTSKAIYAPKKLEFMGELFNNIFNSRLPQRKQAANQVIQSNGDNLESFRSRFLTRQLCRSSHDFL
jgi:hypothetical protein